MDIPSLETFIKTAELLHFGRASRACNLSPSALTRTIQRLEEEVGLPLFLRDNRSVALTDAGNQLLAYARDAVQEWKQFRETVSVNEKQISGSISVYASITAVYCLLPELSEAYRTNFPDVQLELRTGAAERAIEQINSGEIDLAIAALPDDRKHASMPFLPLAETPLLFIAPKRYCCSTKTLDFAQEPLVVPQSGLARNRLDALFRKNHIVPNISTEVSGNEALIAMVRLGAGIGIVPQLALDRSPFRDDVITLHNAPKLAPYVVGLCSSNRNLKRPAVKAMWTLAEALSK